MAFRASSRDQLTELVDAGALLLNPFVDRLGWVLVANPRQELDPKLLEIARQARGEESLPLIGGNEAGDLLLCPVEAERLAQPRVGAGQRAPVVNVAASILLPSISRTKAA